MMGNIEQMYHHYTKWEDWQNGMWRNVYGGYRKELLRKAIKFTGNAELYGHWMVEAVNQWPITCEHNLSNLSINRQAFIGHCAVCLAIESPEDVTRCAWHYLTKKQQDDANAMADKAIALWEAKYAES